MHILGQHDARGAFSGELRSACRTFFRAGWSACTASRVRRQVDTFVTVHSARCAGCVEYLHALAGIQSELEIWEARFLVIVPGSLTEAQRLRSPVGTVLSDEHGLLAEDRSANVIVADRFGQVFDVARSSGAGHDLRGLRELEEWLKYLGTLCPE